jgi:hypothetical protein
MISDSPVPWRKAGQTRATHSPSAWAFASQAMQIQSIRAGAVRTPSHGEGLATTCFISIRFGKFNEHERSLRHSNQGTRVLAIH